MASATTSSVTNSLLSPLSKNSAIDVQWREQRAEAARLDAAISANRNTRKLAREPQIHGGKKSRVVFTDEGEKSVKRDDR